MSGFNFVLTGSAAQRVHDSLICLSKFSEYVCLEARRNRLTLSALNSTKSAYGAVALSSTRFFEEYQFAEDYGADADAEGPLFTCRLYAKVAPIPQPRDGGMRVIPAADTSSPRLS